MKGTSVRIALLITALTILSAALLHSQIAPDQNQQNRTPRDLSGLWMDGEQYVVIVQSGSSVTATYVEDYLCSYAQQKTRIDFQAALKGDELKGKTSVCESEHVPKLRRPGYDYQTGLQMAPIHLKVSPDGRTLAGTYLHAPDNKEYPIRIVREDEEQQLSLARRLLSEVDQACEAAGPSRACASLGNWDELQEKRYRARAAMRAVLEVDPQNAEGIKLLAQISPTLAEAQATLGRLTALVKGGRSRNEVEAVHTSLRKLARQLDTEAESDDAERYEQRAQELWASYSSTLAKVSDVCPGCPALEVTALAKEFGHPRLLGAGDYTLDELAWMSKDPASQKPAYASLVTGDFTRQGKRDVALIGRGERKGKEALFLLIASVHEGGYRPLFLQPLEWNRAALTVAHGTLILSETFSAGDDYWTLIWGGTTFHSRYAGEELSPDGEKEALSTRKFKLITRPKDFALQFVSQGNVTQVKVPRDWLVPQAEEEEAEQGNYVSSFSYDGPVTSFPIGTGRIGLHLSSYDIQRGGTAHAAAGRDVFLIFDPKSLVVSKGGIERGVTKWRARSEGCLSAAAEHYLLADIDQNGLVDIGVVKEEIQCVEKYSRDGSKEWMEPSYKQHAAVWYIFRDNVWRLEPKYSGKIPESFVELPLIGSAAADVDDLPLGLWRSFDPSKWATQNGSPPAYVPPYWKNQLQKPAAPRPRGIDKGSRGISAARPTLAPEIHAVTVHGITAHFSGEKRDDPNVALEFGVEQLWFTFEGDPKQYVFRPSGELYFSDWSFDIFSPDGAYVLLLQDHYGPYHVVAAHKLRDYLTGHAKPDYVVTNESRKPDEPAQVHHEGHWVSSWEIQFTVSCCGTSETITYTVPRK